MIVYVKHQLELNMKKNIWLALLCLSVGASSLNANNKDNERTIKEANQWLEEANRISQKLDMSVTQEDVNRVLQLIHKNQSIGTKIYDSPSRYTDERYIDGDAGKVLDSNLKALTAISDLVEEKLKNRKLQEKYAKDAIEKAQQKLDTLGQSFVAPAQPANNVIVAQPGAQPAAQPQVQLTKKQENPQPQLKNPQEELEWLQNPQVQLEKKQENPKEERDWLKKEEPVAKKGEPAAQPANNVVVAQPGAQPAAQQQDAYLDELAWVGDALITDFKNEIGLFKRQSQQLNVFKKMSLDVMEGNLSSDSKIDLLEKFCQTMQRLNVPEGKLLGELKQVGQKYWGNNSWLNAPKNRANFNKFWTYCNRKTLKKGDKIGLSCKAVCAADVYDFIRVIGDRLDLIEKPIKAELDAFKQILPVVVSAGKDLGDAEEMNELVSKVFEKVIGLDVDDGFTDGKDLNDMVSMLNNGSRYFEEKISNYSKKVKMSGNNADEQARVDLETEHKGILQALKNLEDKDTIMSKKQVSKLLKIANTVKKPGSKTRRSKSVEPQEQGESD